MPPPPPPSQQMVMPMVNPAVVSQVKRIATVAPTLTGPSAPIVAINPGATPNVASPVNNISPITSPTASAPYPSPMLAIPKSNNNKGKKPPPLSGKEDVDSDILLASQSVSGGLSTADNKNGNSKSRKRPPSNNKSGTAGANPKRRKGGVASTQCPTPAAVAVNRKEKTEPNSYEFTLYRKMIDELKSKFPPGESFGDLLCSPRYMGSVSLLPPVGGSPIPDDKIHRCLYDDKAWMRGHVSKYASGAFSLPPIPTACLELKNTDDSREYWMNREEKPRTPTTSLDVKVPSGPLLNSQTIVRPAGQDVFLEYIPSSPQPVKRLTPCPCIQLKSNTAMADATPPLSPRYTEESVIKEERRTLIPDNSINKQEPSPVMDDKMIEVVLTGRPALRDSALQRVDASPKIDSETGEILLDQPPTTSCDSTDLLNENMAAALDAIDPNLGPSSIKGARREAGLFRVTVQLSSSQKPYIDQFVERLSVLLDMDPETAKYDVRISDSHPVPNDFLGNVREVNRVKERNQKPPEEPVPPVDTTQFQPYREDAVRVTDLISSRKRPKVCRHCRRPLPLFYFIHRRISDLNSGIGHTFKSDPDNEDEFFCDLHCERQFIQRLITYFPNPGNISPGMGIISMMSNLSGAVGGQNDESSSVLPTNQVIDYRHELYVGEKPSVVPVVLQGPPPKSTRALKRTHSHMGHIQASSQVNPSLSQNSLDPPPQKKRMKGIKWKIWTGADHFSQESYSPPSADEVRAKLSSLSGCIKNDPDVVDKRTCLLCRCGFGDEDEEGPGRLLNLEVDRWIHLNCALWLYDVYETQSGSLCEVESSVIRAKTTKCSHCGLYGSGLPCYRKNCPAVFHLPCALKTNCMFFTDRGMYCSLHRLMTHPMHLPSLIVDRRVYINRNEYDQVAKVLRDRDFDEDTKPDPYIDEREYFFHT